MEKYGGEREEPSRKSQAIREGITRRVHPGNGRSPILADALEAAEDLIHFCLGPQALEFEDFPGSGDDDDVGRRVRRES